MTTAENVDVKANAADADIDSQPRRQAATTCPMINPHTQLRCGQAALPETGYCTHHAPGRVPCPVDPRHFVGAKNLRKHVQKCNATKRAAELSARPFYRRGTNRGRRGRPTLLELEAQREAGEADRDGSSAFKRPRLAPARRAAAEALGHEKVIELLRRIREAADRVLAPVFPPPPPPPPPPPSTEARKADVTSLSSPHPPSGHRPVSDKHDSQNGAIVGVALSSGVFGSRRRRRRINDDEDDEEEESVAVVELGAGRGYLGAAAADALVALDRERAQQRNDDDGDGDDDSGKTPTLPLRCSALVLVDRRAYRNKAERHYRGEERGDAAKKQQQQQQKKKQPPPPFALSRATVDLADVSLSSLPGVSSKDSIALLGKHLCGPATDFSLRAAVTQLRLCSSSRSSEEEEEEEKSEKKRHALSGLAIATCCHHCCTWSDFCGKREFLSQGFAADEFEIVAQCSAWATGGHGRRPKEEKQEQDEGGKGTKRKANGGGDEEEEEDEQGEDDDEEGEEDETKEEQARCWQTRIPIDERRRSGDAAKRLLDGCRVLWLRRHSSSPTVGGGDAAASADADAGDDEAAAAAARSSSAPSSPSPSPPMLLSVEARPYAPEGVTGENRLIVAVPMMARKTRAGA